MKAFKPTSATPQSAGFICTLLVLFSWLVLSVSASYGALDAFDEAAGANSWAGGDNRGFGFSPWQFSTTSGEVDRNGHVLLESAIGISWALYANEGNVATAIRPFQGGALTVGKSFSITMLNSLVDAGGSVGFHLCGGGLARRLSFSLAGGDSTYKVTANSQVYDTGVADSSSGLEIQFTQYANNQFSLYIIPGTGATGYITGTLAASDISSVELFNQNAGANPPHDLFFGKLLVGPSAFSSWMQIIDRFKKNAKALGAARDILNKSYADGVAQYEKLYEKFPLPFHKAYSVLEDPLNNNRAIIVAKDGVRSKLLSLNNQFLKWERSYSVTKQGVDTLVGIAKGALNLKTILEIELDMFDIPFPDRFGIATFIDRLVIKKASAYRPLKAINSDRGQYTTARRKAVKGMQLMYTNLLRTKKLGSEIRRGINIDASDLVLEIDSDARLKPEEKLTLKNLIASILLAHN